MKSVNRLKISILASGALALVIWTVSALAQGGNPPASTTESGQSSGHGQTAAEQATPAGHETSLKGCLSGPNQEGVYTLTNAQHKNGIEVATEKGVDLKEHVGHEVKLTGMWAGGAMGEHEKMGATHEKGERHFKATNVEHIASSCTSAGEMPRSK